MHLNHEGQVWVRCCQEWRDPYKELWIFRENDNRIDIVCIKHPEVHLGYDDDLPQPN
jgi:hypothetical protein